MALSRRFNNRSPQEETCRQFMSGILVLLILVPNYIFGYSNTPFTSSSISVCWTMLPTHGSAQPQTSAAPYKLSISGPYGPYCFVPGQTINVTLSGSSISTTFRGFCIQARLVGNMQYIPYGVFSAAGNANVQPLTCYSTANNTVGHTNGNNKSSVTFRWTPPPSLTSDITFITTVVQTLNVFWVSSALLTINVCDLTVPQPYSIVRGESIIVEDQGMPYNGCSLYGNNVMSLSDQWFGTLVTTSFVDVGFVLPDGILTEFYFFVSGVRPIDNISRRMSIQVWRPIDETQKRYQLVWIQTVSVYPQITEAIYKFSLVSAKNTFRAVYGDRIGWNFEGQVTPMPNAHFGYQSRMYIQKSPAARPTVGQIVDFENEFQVQFSYAVLLNLTGFLTTTPPPPTDPPIDYYTGEVPDYGGDYDTEEPIEPIDEETTAAATTVRTTILQAASTRRVATSSSNPTTNRAAVTAAINTTRNQATTAAATTVRTTMLQAASTNGVPTTNRAAVTAAINTTRNQATTVVSSSTARWMQSVTNRMQQSTSVKTAAIATSDTKLVSRGIDVTSPPAIIATSRITSSASVVVSDAGASSFSTTSASDNSNDMSTVVMKTTVDNGIESPQASSGSSNTGWIVAVVVLAVVLALVFIAFIVATVLWRKSAASPSDAKGVTVQPRTEVQANNYVVVAPPAPVQVERPTEPTESNSAYVNNFDGDDDIAQMNFAEEIILAY